MDSITWDTVAAHSCLGRRTGKWGTEGSGEHSRVGVAAQWMGPRPSRVLTALLCFCPVSVPCKPLPRKPVGVGGCGIQSTAHGDPFLSPTWREECQLGSWRVGAGVGAGDGWTRRKGCPIALRAPDDNVPTLLSISVRLPEICGECLSEDVEPPPTTPTPPPPRRRRRRRKKRVRFSLHGEVYTIKDTEEGRYHVG